MPLDVSVRADQPGSTDLTIHLLSRGESSEHIPTQALSDAENEAVLVYQGDARAGVVLIGERGDRLEALRIAGASAAALANRVRAANVAVATTVGGDDEVEAIVEGFVLGAYRFAEYRQEKAHAIESLILVGEGVSRHESAVRVALIRAEATCFARDLVNRSPHDKTAPLLADAAKAMADEVGLRCEVWERDRIEVERMGGLLAVNRGSVEPPRFVILEHNPGGVAGQAPVVLVGKAIVFDTGGLSLKDTKGSMDKMKADMAGGAAVLGTMLAAARLDLPVRVIALIPMTDNRPGGEAYVPGEVVTMRSGLNVEVMNTDAEGRMILADALDYARELNPRLVVDVATLTGSVVVALGNRVAGLMTPEDDYSEERIRAFVEAGRATGEFVHPLPMDPHFAEGLETEVADLMNVGGRDGGAITAGKFLERFTQTDGEAAYPWTHIDIAGTAFTDSPQPYRSKGGTGFGVRLLTAMLEQWSKES